MANKLTTFVHITWQYFAIHKISGLLFHFRQLNYCILTTTAEKQDNTEEACSKQERMTTLRQHFRVSMQTESFHLRIQLSWDNNL